MAKYVTRALAGSLPINDTSSFMVLIGGIPVFVEAGSLSIGDTIGKRSQASFVVRTNDGSTHYQQYQQVSIYDASNALTFSGYITNPQETKPGFRSTMRHQITCTDQHFLADKRIIAKAYTNRTRASIVQDIAATILHQEGVTVGAIVDEGSNTATLYPGGSVFPSTTLFPQGDSAIGVINAVFAYCTVAAALDALTKDANLAGIPYYWSIDQFKRLWWVPYTYIVNSTIVDGSLIDQQQTPTVSRQNPAYRDQQYIIGGVTQTVLQTETKLGDGNATSWIMGFDLASAPTISVNLNGAGYVTKAVGVKGVDTGKDFYWQAGSSVITQDSGGTKLRGPTGTVDLLQVAYIGQYPTVALANNSTQIRAQATLDGTSGLIEEVEVAPTITALEDAFSKATGLLTRLAVQGMQLKWQQKGNAPGYASGQLVTVNLPQHALYNAQMLIGDVQASDSLDGYNLWYAVTAIMGPYDVTWQDFFGAIIQQQQPSNSITVGQSQSLTLLTQFSVAISLTATLTATVYACPIISSTLFPSATLFPC